MGLEKRKRFLINIAYFSVILGFSIVFMRYAFPALVPFIAALIVSFILKPAVRFVSVKLRLSKNVSAVILTLLFYATIGLLLALVGISVYNVLEKLVSKLPDLYRNQIAPAMWDFADALEQQISRFTDNITLPVQDTFSEIISSMGSAISNFSVKMISAAGNTAISVPGILLKIVITVISTVFLSMDWTLIRNFAMSQFSEKTQNVLQSVLFHLGRIIKKYIVSYAVIMTITFIEIFIGLKIISVNGAVWIAALIAVFDILPIVGSGLVLFPWSVIALFSGDLPRGIGLLILWAVVIIVRYIIEPKIIGDNVGLHPLLTLFAMITGNFLFGGIGILLLPVTFALCQELNSAGIIHLYKPLHDEKTPEVRKSRLGDVLNKWLAALWKFIKGIFKFKKKK